MSLEETDVVRALDALRMKGLAMQAHGEGSRVPKYRHSLAEKLFLEPEELAILCELFLRGPQTVGELRGRADRMHDFEDLAQVEAVLQELMETPAAPGRQASATAGAQGTPLRPPSGGEPEMMAGETGPGPRSRHAEGSRRKRSHRCAGAEVEALRSEVAELRRMLEEFRAQFE